MEFQYPYSIAKAYNNALLENGFASDPASQIVK